MAQQMICQLCLRGIVQMQPRTPWQQQLQGGRSNWSGGRDRRGRQRHLNKLKTSRGLPIGLSRAQRALEGRLLHGRHLLIVTAGTTALLNPRGKGLVIDPGHAGEGPPLHAAALELIKQSLALVPCERHAPQNVLLQEGGLISLRSHKRRSHKATTLTDYDRPTVLGLTDTLRTIHFHAVLPLTAAELSFKLKHGADALMERLEKAKVTELLDIRRKSVV